MSSTELILSDKDDQVCNNCQKSLKETFNSLCQDCFLKLGQKKHVVSPDKGERTEYACACDLKPEAKNCSRCKNALNHSDEFYCRDCFKTKYPEANTSAPRKLGLKPLLPYILPVIILMVVVYLIFKLRQQKKRK
jgi:predicted amidophosphoribosyltransferase